MKTHYIRSLLKIGGSYFVALPMVFLKRNRMEFDRKVIVEDSINKMEVMKMTNENLKKIKK